jgi:dipeptidyl aminopeptidase/acylaminoacyl peptidase
LTGKEYAVSTNSDVYVYDLKTKKTTNISKGNKGYDLDPVFSPDGKMLAWTSMEKDGYESDRYRIMVMDFDTKETKELTKGWDFNAHSAQWSADGQAMFFTSETQGTQQLFRVNLSGGQPSQITIGQHNFYGFEVTRNSLVATKATMSMPHEIFNVGLASGKARQITFTNTDQLAKTKMGKVESRTVKTTDGKDMLVWVIYPPDFDSSKKYPALLYCQGGPQSQVSQFWSYRWNFQMMAANDYIIVAPNRRGLPGFAWNEEISGDWGGQAQQDLLSAIDAVKKEPYVNEDKLGAVGASYGGYSVYWLAGNHNKRFKSFVSHCGLFNLESWYGSTEESFFANQDIGGAYWEKDAPKSYKEFSPHKYVGNWDTPILVIHGEKDFRVPIGEGMQAFNAAQLQDIPSRFLYFPDESHWVLTPQNGILWQRVFFDWLARDLKTGGTKPKKN